MWARLRSMRNAAAHWTSLDHELRRGCGRRIGDRDLLRFTAELLVPRFECVGAGRQPVKFEAAVVLRHRKERIRDDVREGAHPAMQIALERYANLGLVERLRD